MPARCETPTGSLDGSSLRQRLLRLACHGIPVHTELIDHVEEPLELTRIHVPFRLQEARELSRVRLEVDLPRFPLLHEFEAARVGTNADTGARDHGLGPFRGSAVISLRSE